MKNLFDDVPTMLAEELVTVLADYTSVRIERIVSTGQNSPEGFWYDQDEHEWVVVLKGTATLQFDDDPSPIGFGPGDHVNIPAHRRHRIIRTSADEPTVWLAVFYRDQ